MRNYLSKNLKQYGITLKVFKAPYNIETKIDNRMES